METVVLLVILIGAVSGDSHHDRRILLHSDVDIAQAIQSLKADSVEMSSDLHHLQNQNAQLQNTVSNLQRNVSQLHSHNSQLQGTVSQLQSQNSQLQSTVSHLQSTNKDYLIVPGTGSTYVRWGRTVCPANGTRVAYSGYMGGGRSSEPGAAVNFLCLTADPIWDHYTDKGLGRVNGVEYEFYHQADGGADFFGTNMHNQNAPCAVCHSPRSAAMMIPGRNQCYPGWTKEYSGYLVSGASLHTAATEYICLDRRPESFPGGGRDDNDNMLFLVKGICGGSLECPPYINGRELTCVVCTE